MFLSDQNVDIYFTAVYLFFFIAVDLECKILQNIQGILL